MTGLRHARGELVFLIDSDLEEDPELLTVVCRHARQPRPPMLSTACSRQRRGGSFERWSGRLFFRLFNLMSDYPIPENLLTVRLMTTTLCVGPPVARRARDGDRRVCGR